MKSEIASQSPPCQVEVFNRQREVALTISTKSVADIVRAVLENESATGDWVAIHFLSDKKMRFYHKRFFHDSSSTDCMSFPIDGKGQEEGIHHLGDVFICPMTALKYSQNHEILFWHEISLYIIHGILHLLGYDDIDPKDRAMMRRRERSALSFLKKHNMLLRGAANPGHKIGKCFISADLPPGPNAVSKKSSPKGKLSSKKKTKDQIPRHSSKFFSSAES